ncbi:MAG: FAD-dependent oxidoreductase [Deltaproteobacteria bacterium]|nr:FAD-dependent oxidoreductase [Deltaproteobacteria bacterium]
MKNRIVMPPMATRFASSDGHVTNRMIHYYEERAKGGVALIIVEFTAIERRGKTSPFQLMIDDDKFIPGLKRLSNSIKKHGAVAAIQLQHGGVKTSVKVTQMQPVGPSALTDFPDEMGPAPRSLMIREIHDLALAFSKAARRAREAGFDAIELHGTHSYLIDQFISPRFNRRTDIYGGNRENRIRFACEIIQCIKKKAGFDYPIIFRMTGDDYVERGITLEDAKFNAKFLEKSGVDCLHVSVGISDNMVSTPPMSFQRGCFVHLAYGVKNTVNIPVIAVGRINDPIFAEQVLKEKKADLIAMGRSLLADPYLPSKVKKGEIRDIVPCIACNRGCISRVKSGLTVSCLANPAVGKEAEFKIKITDKTKKLLIVGAGPAGMEAARVAALRGHKVIMHEKLDWVGGQLNLAWVPPYKGEVKMLLDYYQEQMKKLKIELHLRSEVTSDLIKKLKPDVLLLSTGAIPILPKIPGIHLGNVAVAHDVLAGKAKVMGSVFVLGSRRVALETAEYLFENGNDVTIVARARDIGLDLLPREHMFSIKRLKEKNIKIITNALVKEIQWQGLLIEINGREKFFNTDNIIIAWGLIPNQTLIKEIDKLRHEFKIDVYMAGDCIAPRNALEAIHEGAWIAREI